MSAVNPVVFMSKEDIEHIHQNTLRILDEVGIFLSDSNARDVLCDNGARCEPGKIFIPPDLVEKCINLAGKQVTVMGRGE